MHIHQSSPHPPLTPGRPAGGLRPGRTPIPQGQPGRSSAVGVASGRPGRDARTSHGRARAGHVKRRSTLMRGGAGGDPDHDPRSRAGRERRHVGIGRPCRRDASSFSGARWRPVARGAPSECARARGRSLGGGKHEQRCHHAFGLLWRCRLLRWLARSRARRK